MKRACISMILAVLVILAGATAAPAASPPPTMNYQGVLRDAAGAPLDGSHDMIFRFFDAETGGNEILVEEHLAAGTGAVGVSAGLFTVGLGTGDLRDGSEPTGIYTRLDSLFRDYSSIWMEIEVGAEILSPRLPVRAAPYALNADTVGGLEPIYLVTTRAAAQTLEGDLTVDGTIAANGGRLTMTGNSTIALQGALPTLSFDLDGNEAVPEMSLSAFGNLSLRSGLTLGSASEQIYWNSLNGFSMTDNLRIPDRLKMGPSGAQSLFWNDPSARFELSSGLQLSRLAGTQLELVDPFADPDAQPGISFTSVYGTKVLSWRSAFNYFRMTDNLLVDGYVNATELRIGSGTLDHNGTRFTIAGDLEAQAFWGNRFETTGTFDLNGTDNRFNSAAQHRVMIDSDNSTTSNFVGWYHDGTYSTTTQLAKLQESGNLQLAGVLQENVAFDIAESFLALEPLEPGDLVRIAPGRVDGVRKTTGENDRTVIGVISSRPGVLLGGAPFSVEALRRTWGDVMADNFLNALPMLREELALVHPEMAEVEDDLIGLALERYWEQNVAPVALSGRVPVKVDGGYGTIEVGDYLAPSPIPGVAMKAISPGPVIGMALEPLAGGAGMVTAFIHRGHYGGDSAPVQVSPAADGGAGASSMEAALEPVAEEIVEADPIATALEETAPGAPSLPGALLDAMPSTGAVLAGQVLVMDRERPGSVEPATVAGDKAVVGIAVEPAGFVVPDGQVVLALAGIVEVQADAGYGPIQVGDALVTSHTPGCVMRVDDPAPMTVVGKALTGLDSGTGAIQVLLMMR